MTDNFSLDTLRILRSHWKGIAIAAVVGAVAIGALSASRPAQWQASTKVQLVDVDSDSLVASTPQYRDAERARQTEIAVIESNSIRDLVEAAMPDPDQLLAIDAAGVGATDILELTTTARSAAGAQEAAALLGQIYVEEHNRGAAHPAEQRLEQIRDQLADIAVDIAAIDAAAGDDAQRRADRDALVVSQVELRRLADRFEIEAALRQESAELIETAELPAAPVSPRPLRDGVLFGFVCAVLAAGTMIARARLDTRLRSVDAVRRAAGDLPLLATIPEVKGKGKDVKGDLLDAYRDLRTSIDFFGLEHPIETLLVLSPNSGVGKTTTVATLGRVFAGSGRSVSLVDCDLRRPALHGALGIDREPGLTSVLTKQIPLSESAREVAGTKSQRLRAYTAGPIPSNPPDLLVSRGMASIMDSIKLQSDTVIIDSPPTSAAPDALILSRVADAAIVVARIGRTRSGELQRLLERLTEAGVPVAGVIASFVPSSDAGYEPYYAYGDSAEVDTDSTFDDWGDRRTEKLRLSRHHLVRRA